MNLRGEEAPSAHIIVAGAGRVGCSVAEVLSRLQLPFVVIELDHRRIDQAKGRGYPTVFGDAAQPTVLEAAGIARARLVLVTTPVLGVSASVVTHARRLNPGVDIVVRAESGDAMASLRTMGVAEVVQPELEASLEMTRQALVHLRMPALDIVQLTDRLRAEHYAGDALTGTEGDSAVIATLAAASRLLDLRWVRIADGSLLAGRSIGEADVRTWLNVTIAGVVRDGQLTTSPGPDYRFEPGDLAAVVGDREHVDGFEVAAGFSRLPEGADA